MIMDAQKFVESLTAVEREAVAASIGGNEDHEMVHAIWFPNGDLQSMSSPRDEQDGTVYAERYWRCGDLRAAMVAA